jgi:REP-associated tyrosine transposase
MSPWPHAPLHYHDAAGAYIITAGTYRKLHLFRTNERLALLQNTLLSHMNAHAWQVQAWAVFSNHYHVVAVSDSGSMPLKNLIQELHSKTALAINQIDGAKGRQVWFQYWDTHLTLEKSYLARLNYVIENPVRHRLVARATNYPWCSATWFQERATRAFFKSVTSFKTDRVNVRDDFEVVWEQDELPDDSAVPASDDR